MQRAQVQSLLGAQESHMPQGQEAKTENKSSIVTNSIKDFKNIIHIRKIFKKRVALGTFLIPSDPVVVIEGTMHFMFLGQLYFYYVTWAYKPIRVWL